MPSSGELGLLSSSNTGGGVTNEPMVSEDGIPFSTEQILSIAASGQLGSAYDEAELIVTSPEEDAAISEAAADIAKPT